MKTPALNPTLYRENWGLQGYTLFSLFLLKTDQTKYKNLKSEISPKAFESCENVEDSHFCILFLNSENFAGIILQKLFFRDTYRKL